MKTWSYSNNTTNNPPHRDNINFVSIQIAPNPPPKPHDAGRSDTFFLRVGRNPCGFDIFNDVYLTCPFVLNTPLRAKHAPACLRTKHAPACPRTKHTPVPLRVIGGSSDPPRAKRVFIPFLSLRAQRSNPHRISMTPAASYFNYVFECRSASEHYLPHD